jgi:hypothetical protein
MLKDTKLPEPPRERWEFEGDEQALIAMTEQQEREKLPKAGSKGGTPCRQNS